MASGQAVSSGAGRTTDVLVVLMEEYRSLREEILERQRGRTNIVAANITLTSVGVAAVSLMKGTRPDAALALPLISVVFGILYANLEAQITVAARYLHQRLRPAVVRATGANYAQATDVLGWEDFKSMIYHRRRISRFLFRPVGMASATLPGLIVLIVVSLGLGLRPEFRAMMTIDAYALYGFDLVCYAMLIVMTLLTASLYSRIVKPVDETAMPPSLDTTTARAQP